MNQTPELTNKTQEESEEKTNAPAKELSKWSMAFACIIALLLSLTKAFWAIIAQMAGVTGEFGLSVFEIILIAGFLVVAWSPVYFSMYMDKWLKR